MSTPSVQRIAAHLNIDETLATEVRDLIRGAITPLAYPERYPRTNAYNRQCYHDPHWTLLALYAIDEIIGTHGIEGYSNDVGSKGFSYCNTGDSYGPTVMLHYPSNGFTLTSWEDYVESPAGAWVR